MPRIWRRWAKAVIGRLLLMAICWLVDIQRQFERLAAMGDDEYRGFYIEVPRPTPEECGMPRNWLLQGNMTVRKHF